MRWAYDLAGGIVVQRDMPVYDTGDLDAGELLMRSTTAGTQNSVFITAQTGSSAEAVDALGICLENQGSTGDPVTTAPSTLAAGGFNYLRCIVNPFAVYRCLYSTLAADDVAVTSASTGTTLTITSLQDDIDGGWVYFPLASGGAAGILRFLTASAAGSATLDSAATVTTADTIIKILPTFHRLTALKSGSIVLTSQAAAGSGTSLQVVENWIQSPGYGFVPLRYADHKAVNIGTTGVNFYADLHMLDHVFNTDTK